MDEPRDIGHGEQAVLQYRFAQGDSQAGALLLESVRRWAMVEIRRLRKPARINDLDIWDDISSKVAQALLTWDPSRSSVTTFLSTVVRRQAISAIAQAASPVSRPTRAFRVDKDKWEAASDTMSLESVGEASLGRELRESAEDQHYHTHVDELAELVEEVMRRLSPGAQRMIELRRQGYSVRDCARIMGLSLTKTQEIERTYRSVIASELIDRGVDVSVWMRSEELHRMVEDDRSMFD